LDYGWLAAGAIALHQHSLLLGPAPVRAELQVSGNPSLIREAPAWLAEAEAVWAFGGDGDLRSR
jgi:hypothetical protein